MTLTAASLYEIVAPHRQHWPKGVHFPSSRVIPFFISELTGSSIHDDHAELLFEAAFLRASDCAPSPSRDGFVFYDLEKDWWSENVYPTRIEALAAALAQKEKKG